MTTGNMHKTFDEARPCGFRVMRTARQTNGRTKILITLHQ